jgi:tetratricopeptide (TPR) repeat protein
MYITGQHILVEVAGKMYIILKLLRKLSNMKTTNYLFIALGLCLVLGMGCQSEKSRAIEELSNIELLRGDLILCSGKEFGEVSFALSCDYSVREMFDLAISLLHSFEYREAEKAFVRVIDGDPECAMAYWGVAMSIYHELWTPPKEKDLAKGAKLIEIARLLELDEREKSYIDAIAAYYDNWETLDHKTRAENYEQKMKALYMSDSTDVEATVFYALALNSTADPKDESLTNQKKAGAILEELFRERPNHPGIAHYIIHNYDNPPLAHKALETARRYADIAPSSAHAQHMPSHIFTRLGLWNESVSSNINSASSAVCYTEEAGMEGHWFQEVHAIDYLVYAYLQMGDNKKAREQYEYLKTMKNVNPEGMFAIAYPFAAVPARISLENKDWKSAAGIEVHESNVDFENFPWQEAIVHYARGLGGCRSGDLDLAQGEIEKLKALHEKLVEEKSDYFANQVLIQIKTCEAWLALGNGDQELALQIMREATDLENGTNKHPVTPCEVLPAAELLGDMLMILDQPDEALRAYEENLRMRPNRFNSLHGAALAAQASGDREKAREYYGELVSLGEGNAEQRKELLTAEAQLSEI